MRKEYIGHSGYPRIANHTSRVVNVKSPHASVCSGGSAPPCSAFHTVLLNRDLVLANHGGRRPSGYVCPSRVCARTHGKARHSAGVGSGFMSRSATMSRRSTPYVGSGFKAWQAFTSWCVEE